MRLVEVLVDRGFVAPAQLGSLLGNNGVGDEQVVAYLVETGALSTDQLAQALGIVCGVPPALDRDFARADPELRKRLAAHNATKLRAIPLYFTPGRRVAVAMVEPTHPKMLDELGFVFGAAIEPMVTSEFAFNHQLERLYAVPTRRTGFRLAVGAAAPTSPAQEHAKRTLNLPPLATYGSPVGDSAAKASAQVAVPPVRPRSKTQTLSNLPAAKPMPMFVPAGADAGATVDLADVASDPVPRTGNYPRVSITGSDTAVEQILCASDHQAAADHLFDFMRACFGAGAMFSVDGMYAAGRFGYSQGNPCPKIEGLVLSLAAPSCISYAFRRLSIFHGPPPPEGQTTQHALWEALGCEPPSEVLVAPVVVGGEAPLLLYAQARNGASIEAFSVRHLERVASAVADTLLRLAG